MDVISYTALRNDLAKTMERVCNNHKPVVVTRQKARPVVMMSLEDYNAIEETLYLTRNPANAKRLLKSIEEIKAGKATTKELID